VDYDRPVSPDETRRISLTFGVLFLITFVTSILALWLYQPVLDDPAGYVAGAGHDNRIFLGAFLELLLIIANIGTAIVVYPLLKRVNEVCAVGYVTARIVECTFILVGILSVLAVVSLQQSTSAGSEETLGSIAYTLAAIKDWTFLLGPGFVVGVGNELLLGYLMYRSELVPRRMAMLGLVGGAAHLHLRHRRHVRCRPAERHAPGHRDHPRVPVRAVAWDLPDRVGLQGRAGALRRLLAFTRSACRRSHLADPRQHETDRPVRPRRTVRAARAAGPLGAAGAGRRLVDSVEQVLDTAHAGDRSDALDELVDDRSACEPSTQRHDPVRDVDVRLVRRDRHPAEGLRSHLVGKRPIVVRGRVAAGPGVVDGSLHLTRRVVDARADFACPSTGRRERTVAQHVPAPGAAHRIGERCGCASERYEPQCAYWSCHGSHLQLIAVSVSPWEYPASARDQQSVAADREWSRMDASFFQAMSALSGGIGESPDRSP
jgi:hypothetical protein